MGSSPLSFASSASFRNKLIAKNLAPYNVPGVYSPPSGPIVFEPGITDLNVVNSDDNLIAKDPYADKLYPLNTYGPDGGYQKGISYNGPLSAQHSNLGPYEPKDTALDLVNEFFIDSAYIQNVYGPVGGFNSMVEVDDTPSQNRIYSPYWDSPSFVPSFYTPYDVLTSDNPTGSDGSLSQDSYLARLGAVNLKHAIQYRIDREIRINTVGAINLDVLQDPLEASLVATGQEPFVYKNYQITVPANPITGALDLATRLGSAYFPVSFIPGSYFNEPQKGFINQTLSNASNSIVNTLSSLVGLNIGGALEKTRQPSQLFLNNTGSGQRSVLFANLEMNLYGPQYEKGIGGKGTAILNVANNLLNTNLTQVGQYYIGNKNAEPSLVESPSNMLPVDQFGRQVQTIVFGPNELGKLYEGNENTLNFGLAGKSSSDGGGTDGQLVWVSPKYKQNAGFHVGKGGEITGIDGQFNIVSNDYTRDESTNIDFKPGSILYNTQKLINAADNVQGVNRLKHVGTAINQVSKVFNDGYKEITKGSRVMSYINQANGTEEGIEYCRIFAKDTPYFTYADLQKTDGITTSGRRFGYSILDNTYNLNIAPLKGVDSTNIRDGKVKKYMFSIENLAWRSSNRPGLSWNDLPACEKGPNGGRIMWFPPYDLKFNDTSQASFQGTNFLGRPEPIYTYQNTTRTGQISWKIVVDHPSVINTIINKQLANVSDEKINSILDSFFAGCMKYDIYELAKKFNQLKLSDLEDIVQNISRATPEVRNQTISEISQQSKNIPGNAGGANNSVTSNVTPALTFNPDDYKNIYLYFDNAIPAAGTTNYQDTYNTYTSKSTYDQYSGSALGVYVKTSTQTLTFAKTDVLSFFNDVTAGYAKSVSLINDIYNFLRDNDGNKIQIQLASSASAPDSPSNNLNLSKRRIESVKKFFLNYAIGDKKLDNFGPNGTGQLSFINDEPGGENTTYLRGSTEIPCTVEPVDVTAKDGKSTHESKYFSIPAMACRNVLFKKIIATQGQPKPNTDQSTTTQQNQNQTTSTTPNLPTPPQISLQKRMKDGVSKKILRALFSECDYFEVIKQSNPMIYNSIKEKVRYFNPVFHSMTPEGLNSRLTFLNQCVRPGDTIPVIGTDGNPIYNDAVNTAFGTPPVLILRIGDFYNTKIIPDSVSFTYDPLIYDMNPEGIGVQPMIANVTMSFKIIGGMGLKEPVEQLQNALSFNYYANTEIYDERSTPTDKSYEKIDKELYDSIKQQQNTEANAQTNAGPITTNGGGVPIGELTSSSPTSSSGTTGTSGATGSSGTTGTTGTLSYNKIMDTLETQVKTYVKNLVNQTETMLQNYNLGIVCLTTFKRNFTTGTFNTSPTKTTKVEIYGKSDSYQARLDDLFSKVINDINSETNPLVKNMVDKKYMSNVIRMIKDNMINYINTMKTDFSLKLETTIQNIATQEQGLIDIISKINVVQQGYDGVIDKQGNAQMYQLTFVGDAQQALQNDYSSVAGKMNDFYGYMKGDWAIIPESRWNDTKKTFQPYKDGTLETDESNRFYTIMYQKLTNSNDRNAFVDTVINSVVIKTAEGQNMKKVKSDFSDFTSDLVKTKYDVEHKAEVKVNNDLKNNENYKTLTKNKYYNGNPQRNTTFVTNNTDGAKYSESLKAIYSTVNSNTDKTTYNGKVKLS